MAITAESLDLCEKVVFILSLSYHIAAGDFPVPHCSGANFKQDICIVNMDISIVCVGKLVFF